MYPSSGPPGAGPPQLTPPRRRSGRGLTLGLALVAVFMSTAALVVALIGLVPEPDRVNRVETAPQATTAAADSGDQALCKAIEPLIKEGTSETNSFVALGKPGSVERDAGIPEFVEMTHDWASRAQEVLDAHADSPRYLTRTLQRHIESPWIRRRLGLLDFDQGLVAPLGIVERGFELGRREVVEVAV